MACITVPVETRPLLTRPTLRLGCAVTAAVALAACNGDYRFDLQSVAASDAGGDTALTNACATDIDCRLPNLHCDVISGACFECTLDDHCKTPGKPDCDTALHRCVECGASQSCARGQFCDPSTRVCLTSCHEGDQCAAPAIGCDGSRGACVTCTRDDHCVHAVSGHTCNRASGRCVQCDEDFECAAPTPLCERTSGACVACLAGSDCPSVAPLCNPSGWACVAP